MKWNVHTEDLHFIVNYSGCPKKKHLGDWNANWISHVCHGTPFLPKIITDEQNRSYSDSTFLQIFVWGGKKALSFMTDFVTSSKPAKIKISTILILSPWAWELSSSHTIFQIALVVIWTNVIYSFNVTGESVHNLVNQYFLRDQCLTFQIQTWKKVYWKCRINQQFLM